MQNHANDISNLLFSYTERFDLGDFEGAAELFRHARVLIGAKGESVDYQGLLSNWRSMVIVDPITQTPRTKHTCTNAIIEVDEEAKTATARSYYVVYQQTDTLPLQPIVAGRYHDKFERVDGIWRFCERDYRMMEMVGNMSEHIRNFDQLIKAKTPH